ncbi:hypothetical protein LZF95_04245 [Algoriphagus sp. AGSA1]|uniref:SnoaL-like domain-containing protein n=1 Tax=Algoriphagus sp. AGSA1 TaxID=2907213 RepID=UPI001F355C64|nr:SnoaL-like domain-containing protein [Algoriphagus sp. AGSA1]MCE7053878.1 hypothetical protein [Algoriphagus sp. AGSA1]
MTKEDLSITLQVEQTPFKVYKAINAVDDWWTKIEGAANSTGDTFTVRFGDVYITHRVAELIPCSCVVWEVTDSNVASWLNTRIQFAIGVEGDMTVLLFNHKGMTADAKDYEDCVKGWTKFIKEGLAGLIQVVPVTNEEILERFKTLAAEERWFDIQDDLFSSNVKSIDPPNSPYMGFAEGKAAVRKKGKDFVAKVEEFHGARTSMPVIGGNYIAVGRDMDITGQGFGRIQINEIMLYEVKNGEIVSEQFFY